MQSSLEYTSIKFPTPRSSSAIKNTCLLDTSMEQVLLHMADDLPKGWHFLQSTISSHIHADLKTNVMMHTSGRINKLNVSEYTVCPG